MWKWSERRVSSISVSLFVCAVTEERNPSRTPRRVNLFIFALACEDDMIKTTSRNSHVHVQSPPTRAILQLCVLGNAAVARMSIPAAQLLETDEVCCLLGSLFHPLLKKNFSIMGNRGVDLMTILWKRGLHNSVVKFHIVAVSFKDVLYSWKRECKLMYACELANKIIRLLQACMSARVW